MTDRQFDVVLLGATGFTGSLTAEYLATHAPAGTRWALAGRDGGRLRALRDRLGVDAGVVEADVADASSLRRLAEAGRVLITAVGPYIRYGEGVVAACAEAGTDYVDLTGEPEFVDLTFLRHHATAVRTGARLVHACGFDAIPADLGAFFTVQQLPEGQPIRMRGYLSIGALPSGGTFDSALTALARWRSGTVARARRRRVEPVDQSRRVRGVSGRPGYDRTAGAWVLPLPTIDPQIVVRSARALDRYGPDFSYGHFVALGNPLKAAALGTGAIGVFALAQVPPARRALSRLRPPGSGPTPQQRAKAWFRLRFVADGGDRRVVTEVAAADPAYGGTAKMLAESALCLAHDPLPSNAGQVTTAVAMGDALRARLDAAGISFRVVESR
ncbi:saccharopine dehydrogenase NADP-binding domain-containing protein [Plantactinospora sp. S1510]|uniref:Saccharopine dehydrogenase NADP-binding domain-containing protein n=1 Tax=Plantactinospora alkalitolerans TaxID=2789879 RepID=A0ABS0H513_9ACTN|nr:saccharopine dehydrogenase NADP-binding domain-containing protein [Plantactinospora alkalitolerans]MBF9133212.1 saccharopine dehydrogenase NADP-binding domain-containing protein [Plantactinospora alkalitolerans]